MQSPYRALYRSRNQRMISGVAGGLGEYFSLDPTLVRVLLVLVAVLGWLGPVALVYLILMLVVPEQPASDLPRAQVSPPVDVRPVIPTEAAYPVDHADPVAPLLASRPVEPGIDQRSSSETVSATPAQESTPEILATSAFIPQENTSFAVEPVEGRLPADEPEPVETQPEPPEIETFAAWPFAEVTDPEPEPPARDDHAPDSPETPGEP